MDFDSAPITRSAEPPLQPLPGSSDEIIREAYRGKRTDKLKVDFLKALVENSGRIEAALKLSGASQGQVYRWWDRDARFRRAVDHIRAFLLFLVEVDTIGVALGNGRGSEKLRAFELRSYKPQIYGDGLRDTEEKELPYQVSVIRLIAALKKKDIKQAVTLEDNSDRGTATSGDSQKSSEDHREQVVADAKLVQGADAGPAADPASV